MNTAPQDPAAGPESEEPDANTGAPQRTWSGVPQDAREPGHDEPFVEPPEEPDGTAAAGGPDAPGGQDADNRRYADAAMPITPPTHRVERSIRAKTGAKVIAGIDEVGRGAWAGPVTVCAAITGLRRPPEGLTDSKLLTVKRRTELAAVLDGWVSAHALGHASSGEIDELGMTAALRLAAVRALEGLPVRPDAVILDGNYDYLGTPWQVRTVIKGDQSCIAVSAASVLAKVRRDALMAELGADHADFCFADNAGYPSPVHKTALQALGPTPHHRMSWAFMDALPRWRHLKRTRLIPEQEPSPVEQMGFF